MIKKRNFLFILIIRFFNTALNCDFGLEYSEYGMETYAIPFEFNLLSGRSKYQIETGVGIIIVDPDVMIKSRIDFRTYFINHILFRLAYTPYR